MAKTNFHLIKNVPILHRVCLLLGILLCTFNPVAAATVTLTPAERAWLDAHPEILLGTDASWQPYVKQQTDGSLLGIEPDLLARINELTGANIRLVVGQWRDIVAQAERSELHGLAISAVHSERMKSFLFSTSPYNIARYIFTREGSGFHSMADLRGKKVGVLRGNLTEQKALAHWPEIIQVEMALHQDLATYLLNGEVDAVITSVSLLTIIREEHFSGLELAFAVPDTKTPIVYSIGKAYPELLSIMDKALAAIEPLEIRAILKKWDGLYEQDANIILTEDERAWLHEHPVVRTRILNFPPYQFWEQGPMGISVDLLNYIAHQIGLHIEYQPSVSWPEALRQIENRDGLDLLLTAKHTPERERFLNFSQDYLQLPWMIFTKNTEQRITRLEDVFGKSIVIEKGYVLQKLLAEQYPQIQQILVESTNEALLAVSAGQADAYLGNLPVAQYHIGKMGLMNLKVAGKLDFDQHTQAFAVRKDWPQLVSILDKGLAAIPEAQRNEIQRRYLSMAIQGTAAEFTLSADERAYLDSMLFKRTQTEGWMPFSFVENGKVLGIAEDYWQLIRDKLNLKADATGPMSFAEVLEKIRIGEADFHVCTSRTDDRDAFALFSVPYEKYPIAIATRTDQMFITETATLQEKVVAVGQEHSAYHLLKARYPAIQFLQMPDTRAALKAVETGKAFAAVDILPVLQYQIEAYGNKRIHFAGVTDVQVELQMMVRKQHARLLPLLNRAIAAITPEQRLALHKKWMLRDVIKEKEIDYALLWQVAGVALLIIVLMWYWNRKLVHTQAQLENNRQQLALALQAANLGTWDWWPQSKKLITNDIFLTMLGYSADADFPETTERWAKLVHPDDLLRVSVILMEFINARADGIYRSEYRLRAADDSWRWILDVGQVIEFGQNGKAKRFIGVHIDITEQKHAEQALLEAQQTADAANRAKSEFLANMSHEIRTPMNAIIGLSQLVLDMELGARQRELLGKVHGSAHALLGILNSILDFSKIEANKLELEHTDFRLQSVLDNFDNLLGFRIQKKGLSLMLEIDRQIPTVLRGDPLRLSQVLINLGNNAVKFTEQGEIHVSIQFIAKQDDAVKLRFEVRDTGIGISAEQQTQLFQPFNQADNSMTRRYGGSGLGLVICKRLVELMQGNLTLDSVLGKGTTLYFEIVLALGDVAALEHPHMPEGESVTALHGIKILLVEDNILNQEVALGLLVQLGIDVDCAEDGNQALDMLAEHADYDVVLMDIQMPVMDGYSATREIRRRWPDKQLPIIAMTANAFSSDRDKCLAAGMNDHIAKPIEPPILYRVLQHWIKPHTGEAVAVQLAAPADDTMLPAELSGIEIASGLYYMNGDRARYLKLLHQFRDKYSPFLRKLPFILLEQEAEAGRSVHTLKGLAGSLGAKRLSQAAIELDAAFKQGDKQVIAALGAGEFKAALAEVVEGLALLAEPAVSTTSIPAQDLKAALVELRQQLAQGDFSATSLFAELKEQLVPYMSAETVKQLGQAIERFDFDNALQQLAAIDIE